VDGKKREGWLGQAADSKVGNTETPQSAGKKGCGDASRVRKRKKKRSNSQPLPRRNSSFLRMKRRVNGKRELGGGKGTVGRRWNKKCNSHIGL